MPSWLVSLPDRLDVFLAKEGCLPSRAKAQQAIEAGLVLVNDTMVRKAASRLQEGDQVELLGELPRLQTPMIPLDLGLHILYEDNACLVLQKPASINVHPGSGMSPDEATILHGIAYLFEQRGLPFAANSVLVHRLDRETTGCLLVAKFPAAHHTLQKQFEERTIEKFYLALVAGVPSPQSAVINAPIGRATFERTKMSIIAVNDAREAKTTYRTLAVSRTHALMGQPGLQATLLLCELHTGRTHQLRVHLHAIGHPILGDSTYTSLLSERLTTAYDIRTLCLHAWQLTFTSPANDKRRVVAAPLPSSFTDVLRRMGVDIPQCTP